MEARTRSPESLRRNGVRHRRLLDRRLDRAALRSPTRAIRRDARTGWDGKRTAVADVRRPQSITSTIRRVPGSTSTGISFTTV